MIEATKIAIPFAKSGNKSVIYDTRQQGQAENEATWETGFPPVTMIRKEDGGLPPTGLDFNGIFHDISSNVVFACMGGQYKFDAEYSDKIGGYPKGAILLNNQENKQYISNVDNNKVNFNTANASTLTAWSVISIADIDKLLAQKIDNADFSSALNQKANTSTNINAGNGLTGGGDLTTSRTITLGTPSTINDSSKNTATATSHTHEISKATTSQKGIVQLSNELSDREDLASTPKTANNLSKKIISLEESVNSVSYDEFSLVKSDKLSPAFEKATASSLKVKAGVSVNIPGASFDISGKTISMSNKTPGSDYVIVIDKSGNLSIMLDHFEAPASIPSGSYIVGGFHYSLIPEGETVSAVNLRQAEKA